MSLPNIGNERDARTRKCMVLFRQYLAIDVKTNLALESALSCKTRWRWLESGVACVTRHQQNWPLCENRKKAKHGHLFLVTITFPFCADDWVLLPIVLWRNDCASTAGSSLSRSPSRPEPPSDSDPVPEDRPYRDRGFRSVGNSGPDRSPS